MAAPKVACPDVYAGKGGVKLGPILLLAGAPSGVQFTSPTVSLLPSLAALRIPVIGRQNSSLYFVSQHVRPASAIATLIRAKRRAISTASEPLCSASCTAIWL